MDKKPLYRVEEEDHTHMNDNIVCEPIDKPFISVIVLAWRLEEQLYNCLRSIVSSVDVPAYEIIIVLNGVSDALRHTLHQRVKGATFIECEENIGFGGGCNVGAAAARGTYLLFLNDDATAEPSSIKELCATINASPSIAAVAGVLFHPDGHLQEAGSRILTSGGSVQLGHDKTRETAEAEGFLTTRDIDYGSGAALMVRRSIFDRVGGFDPRYEPAYFEDVDLSFRFKALGYGVKLVGQAFFVHQAGASTSGDIHFREFASDHAGTAFIERWKDVLQTAPAADAPLIELCTVPPDASRAIIQRPAPVTAIHTALAITRNYSEWLSKKVDSLTAQREENHSIVERLRGTIDAHSTAVKEHSHTIENLRIQLTETQTERDTAQDKAHAAEQEAMAHSKRAHLLTERLRDLDRRGPLGILRWKIGVTLNHRAKKR